MSNDSATPEGFFLVFFTLSAVDMCDTVCVFGEERALPALSTGRRAATGRDSTR